MQDCLFKGRIETCIICSYYFACKARGTLGLCLEPCTCAGCEGRIMQDCLFKGRIETCIICSYYFACKARGDVSKRDEDQYFAKKLSQST